MAAELRLTFTGPESVQVSLMLNGAAQPAPAQTFTPPMDTPAQEDLRWYLEVYAAHYTTDIDDDRAERIAGQLQTWGEALYNAVFTTPQTQLLAFQFLQQQAEGRLVTIGADDPKVLGQPWDLLKPPNQPHLFLSNPRISVRRQPPAAGGGWLPYQPPQKDQLHILFVVSRPNNSGFLDPRADAMAVLDAIDAHAPGRFTWEFLRPATLDALTQRLDNTDQPAVDILHFDGHGVFDRTGKMGEKGHAPEPGSEHLRKAVGNQGYLLFESSDGAGHLVTAELLGQMLNQQKVGLVILSACQSAAVGGDDAMGSVAARLLHAGLPSVLAMTHSVLVPTTRALFGQVYGELARGQPVGTALDNARRHLLRQPERGERRRGTGIVVLKLQDWFVPALYQAGADGPLLRATADLAPTEQEPARSNLPSQQETGFHGRRRELWEIERWFVAGTRRVVVHGFGGQGKTALAEEAGRWLVRTGLFDRVCFVSYAGFQGVDPAGVAVATLGTVLDQSLIDAEAAAKALTETPTLVILDNLESLERERLVPLLEAAAGWSAAGQSRVLVTTRQHDLGHAGWPTGGTNACRYQELKGLNPDDAIAWYRELAKLPPDPTVPPPKRTVLETLFDKVQHHPLSIGVLAEVLKHRAAPEAGERLDQLLLTETSALTASLTLSLDRLDASVRAWLPRLSVFQDCAWEPVIPQVCEIDAAAWAPIRRELEQTGLIRAEPLAGSRAPFLRFHPTLRQALAQTLADADKKALTERHWQQYYQLSNTLYVLDDKDPHAARAVARRELANLLAAVHTAFDHGADEAVEFADRVSKFLGNFGLTQDRAALSARAAKTAGQVGSRAWVLARSNLGDQLFRGGRHAEAEAGGS